MVQDASKKIQGGKQSKATKLVPALNPQTATFEDCEKALDLIFNNFNPVDGVSTLSIKVVDGDEQSRKTSITIEGRNGGFALGQLSEYLKKEDQPFLNNTDPKTPLYFWNGAKSLAMAINAMVENRQNPRLYDAVFAIQNPGKGKETP